MGRKFEKLRFRSLPCLMTTPKPLPFSRAFWYTGCGSFVLQRRGKNADPPRSFIFSLFFLISKRKGANPCLPRVKITLLPSSNLPKPSQRHLENGVEFISDNVYIDPEVIIAPGATILPGCILRGATVVETLR